MFINSNNGLLLAKKLEEIPNVSQVRFNYVMREDLVENYGSEAIAYRCRIKSLNQNQKFTVYETLMTIIEPKIYENIDTHGYIQAMMSERVGHYYKTGDLVENVGSFSYPYSLDADGNQIPYEMTKNNPIRT